MSQPETDALLRRAADLERDAARLRDAARRSAGEPGAAPDRAAPGSDPVPHRQAILDSTTRFAIVGTDRDGVVTDWNAGAARIFGWSAADIRGRNIADLFTPEDRAIDRPGIEMRLALEQGRAEDERWHLRADGTRFWASGEMMPLRDGDGHHIGYVKVVSDRTAEHRAGDALQDAEMRLRRAQEAGGIGVFSVGIDDGILHPTPEFCRL